MKIVVPAKEIKIDDLSDLLGTNDKSLTTIKGSGSTKGNGRGAEIDDLTKKMIAIDGAAGNYTGREVAAIYGVTDETVSQKSHGMNTSGPNATVDEELKETVDRVRNKIENAAVSKLMSTLELFNPDGLEDQMQVVTAAQKLAGVVEKVRGKSGDNANKVEIHFYQPRPRDIKSYEVIEVNGQ